MSSSCRVGCIGWDAVGGELRDGNYNAIDCVLATNFRCLFVAICWDLEAVKSLPPIVSCAIRVWEEWCLL